MIRHGLTKAARGFRAVFGQNTALERSLRGRYRSRMNKEVGRHAIQFSNRESVVIRSRGDAEKKVGIFLKGGCDLPSVFLVGQLVKEDLTNTTVAILRPPESIGSSQSAQLLQTLDGVSIEATEETCRRLDIPSNVFRPVLFEKSFDIPGLPSAGQFDKQVVVLSIGSDLVRSLHRHKEHGFLVDLGGWWLNQSLEKAIKDTDTIKWFKQTFEPVGRIGVNEFRANFERIIGELETSVGAQVIVFNTLVVDPSNPTHNYQLLNEGHALRRREFNVALCDLSAQLGFHVVDVDRILKLHGVKEQIDFAHYPLEARMAVARECHRILRELELI